MKNKLFITGLALGIENKECPCRNYNLDWLYNYPSTLLWAEKIIVTKNIWNTITKSDYSPIVTNNKENEIAKSVKLIFEILNSERVLEIVDIKGIISKSVSNNIYKKINHDIKTLSKIYPQKVHIENDEKYIKINKQMYCIPQLWTIYAGFILSRFFNAHGILSNYELNFYNYKYSIASKNNKIDMRFKSFHKVLELNLPNLSLAHMYLFDYEKDCNICANEMICKDSYLKEIEKNTYEIIKARNYDEIQQIVSLLNKISKKSENNIERNNLEDLSSEFISEKIKINKKIKLVFPKIKRWTNLTTFVSVPVALSGLITGNPFLTISGGIVAGLAKSSEELIKYYENKYNWVNYLNRYN